MCICICILCICIMNICIYVCICMWWGGPYHGGGVGGTRNVQRAPIYSYPLDPMYGKFTYIYHHNHLNVAKCAIHGSYGI